MNDIATTPVYQNTDITTPTPATTSTHASKEPCTARAYTRCFWARSHDSHSRRFIHDCCYGIYCFDLELNITPKLPLFFMGRYLSVPGRFRKPIGTDRSPPFLGTNLLGSLSGVSPKRDSLGLDRRIVRRIHYVVEEAFIALNKAAFFQGHRLFHVLDTQRVCSVSLATTSASLSVQPTAGGMSSNIFSKEK